MSSCAASTVPPSVPTSIAGTPDISLLRLYLLRALYALMAVGLGLYIWPDVIDHTDAFAMTHGVRFSLLAGLGATAALGLRYPLRMLPLLIFELVWKAIFLTAFALPLYLSDQLSAGMAEDTAACLMVVIFLPVIPWRHVFANYVTRPGDRWI